MIVGPAGRYRFKCCIAALDRVNGMLCSLAIFRIRHLPLLNALTLLSRAEPVLLAHQAERDQMAAQLFMFQEQVARVRPCCL